MTGQTDPSAEQFILRGHEDAIVSTAFSPDNHWLVTASMDDTARLWDLTAADKAASSIVLRGHDDAIRTVAFSPNSHWLASGGFDATVRLWDMTATDPSTPGVALTGHENFVETLVFSPDGRWLATGDSDRAARLWRMQPLELIATACRTAGRNLMRAEWAQYFPDQSYRKTCAQWPPAGSERRALARY